MTHIKTVKDRVLEYERFKKTIVEYLSKNDNPDKIFMYIGERGYSMNTLQEAITIGSEDGVNMVSNLFKLTIDLLVRDNQELKKKYSISIENTQLKEALIEIVDAFDEQIKPIRGMTRRTIALRKAKMLIKPQDDV